MSDLTQTADASAPASRKSLFKRTVPILVLAGLAAAFFGLGLNEHLTFDALREHRALLTGFVGSYGVLAVAAFVGIYAAATALSLPGGTVLSVAGGFLFNSILGTAWVVIGATIGATIVFLIAKSAFGDALRAKAGPSLRKMERGFQENALSYLLVLRLIPLFPFFVVNLVPAFLGVPLRTYVLGTFIGIIPGAFVFASVGAGLGSVFDSMDGFSATGVLTPQVVTALVGLSVLSLLPVAYKKWKARKSIA